MGRVYATPGALVALEAADASPVTLLARHAGGDWGDLGQEDWQSNDRALRLGGRIFSAYTLETLDRLWVITEADRSATTLLLPQEY